MLDQGGEQEDAFSVRLQVAIRGPQIVTIKGNDGLHTKDHHEWVARCLFVHSPSALYWLVALTFVNVPDSLLTLRPVSAAFYFYPCALTLPCYAAEASLLYRLPSHSSNSKRIECLAVLTLSASSVGRSRRFQLIYTNYIIASSSTPGADLHPNNKAPARPFVSDASLDLMLHSSSYSSNHD